MRQVVLALILFHSFGIGAVSAQSQQMIAKLQLRDHFISIELGEKGTLYTIAIQDGTIVDARLTQQELQEKHPQIYDAIQPAIADQKLSPWAGM